MSEQICVDIKNLNGNDFIKLKLIQFTERTETILKNELDNLVDKELDSVKCKLEYIKSEKDCYNKTHKSILYDQYLGFLENSTGQMFSGDEKDNIKVTVSFTYKGVIYNNDPECDPVCIY